MTKCKHCKHKGDAQRFFRAEDIRFIQKNGLPGEPFNSALLRALNAYFKLRNAISKQKRRGSVNLETFEMFKKYCDVFENSGGPE
jgi:hypothetical protein